MSGNNSGWNRPASNQPTVKKGGAKAPSAMKGLFAGIVTVCALGGLCLWMFSGGEDSPAQGTKPRAQGTIKEVTPAPAPKPKEKTHAEKMRERYPNLTIPDGWEKPYPPPAYRADGSLKIHSRYVTVRTNRLDKAQLGLAGMTFNNIAERDIGSMLLARPGNIVVGDYKFDQKFVDSFLESLKAPIVASKDDTEEQVALKEMVKEAKLELKARYDAGEDIAEIMNETRRQFKELGLYKNEIRKMIADARAAHNGEFTKEDEHDLISAANKMLEDRGCEPLELPETFVEKAQHDNGEENEDE